MEAQIWIISILGHIKELTNYLSVQMVMGNLVSTVFIYKILNKPIQKAVEKHSKEKYLSALVAELLVNFLLGGFLCSTINKQMQKKKVSNLNQILTFYKYQTTALKEAIFRENFGVHFHLRLTMILSLFEMLNENGEKGLPKKKTDHGEEIKRLIRDTLFLKKSIKSVFYDIINPVILDFKLNITPISDTTFSDIEGLVQKNAQEAPWFGHAVEDMEKVKELDNPKQVR